MSDIRTRLRQTRDDIVPPTGVMETLATRRQRLERRKRQGRRKAGAIVIGVVVAVAGVTVITHEMSKPSPSGPTVDGDTIPAILPDARLAPGPHMLDLAGIAVTFDVPEDWRGSDQGVVHSEFGADGPNGAALAFWTVSNVYTDPCHWRRSVARPAGTSVSDLVSALATQQGHPSGDRIKANVAGYDATELEMSVPTSLQIDRCDDGEFHTWQSPQGDRKQEGAGQVDQLFVVDVLGTRVVIDASFFPGTSRGSRSALFDMVRSVHFV
jgi:hypothetical protein